MKLPTPKQKENGKWLIQVMVDGKRIGKEFETEDEALFWAAGIKTKQIENHLSGKRLTVSAAIDRYIESKSSVLSPSTIVCYKDIQRNRLGNIQNINLGDITQEQIQRWVNFLAKTHSPKTVANAHGLISAILREYRPEFALRTTLPHKVKVEIQIPTEADLKAIADGCRGTKYELPIILAMWLGLRMSEIIGLTWDCVEGNILTIKQALVMGENGLEKKGTKSYAGYRKIKMPQYIVDLINNQPRTNDRIVNLTGRAIYSGFCRICNNHGIKHYRFHDLRHANASVMLVAGVPDKYSMKRMGHATNNMLKTTYQHTIKEKEEMFDDMLDAEMERILNCNQICNQNK